MQSHLGWVASITIRSLEEALKRRLKLRAAEHGRSMEEEAREILRAALAESTTDDGDLARAVRRRFAPLGGVELPDVERTPLREPPAFDEP